MNTTTNAKLYNDWKIERNETKKQNNGWPQFNVNDDNDNKQINRLWLGNEDSVNRKWFDSELIMDEKNHNTDTETTKHSNVTHPHHHLISKWKKKIFFFWKWKTHTHTVVVVVE